MGMSDNRRLAAAMAARERAEAWNAAASEAYCEGDADAGDRFTATAETYLRQARELEDLEREATR